jgi:anti-sigma28 factor (negative regulator of flagellin synthesis)
LQGNFEKVIKMKINDGNHPIQRPSIANNSASAKALQSQQTARANVELTTVSTSSTSELQNLLAQSGDVRDSLVADIKIRLAAGEFATQQAAYETAESILNL